MKDKREKVKWGEWLYEKWGMTCLKIKLPFSEMEFKPQDADKTAAWELYIELLTRITTQSLEEQHGDEATALSSIYSLFGTSRETIKRNGRDCKEFTKIAIVVLNQLVRPFTAKWHKLTLRDAFNNPEQCKEFRKELNVLQGRLRTYTKMLADMAGVEDLTDLEDE